MRSIQEKNQICLLDIDVKGAKDIYKSGKFECNYMFVTTPTLDELKRRLINRKTETETTLAKRLGNADIEVKMAEECKLFGKWFINDDQEKFVKEAVSFIVKDLYRLE